MKRVAWFTPLQIAQPGLPSHGVELMARLRGRFAIDQFVDTTPPPTRSDQPHVFSAHDFVWKQRCEPYDLTVYELADSPSYSFVWPYLVRHPGVVVLHDYRLHRSRAESLLRVKRDNDYRMSSPARETGR